MIQVTLGLAVQRHIIRTETHNYIHVCMHACIHIIIPYAYVMIPYDDSDRRIQLIPP